MQYPPEILYAICAQVYASALFLDEPSLDPLIVMDRRVITPHPSIHTGRWPDRVVRGTLASLCLVNHSWFEAAKPWLWHKLEVGLPRTWLSIVEEIAWNYEEETVDSVMEVTIKAATDAAIWSSSVHSNKLDTHSLEESMCFNHLDFPHTLISPNLLSPAPSREPSPRRLHPSPARWKLLRAINDAVKLFSSSSADSPNTE